MAQLFERILLLIEKLENGNQSQFARKIGCPQTTLNGYLNIEGQSRIKVSFLDKVLGKYPDIRPEWLYMGQEPMLKGTPVEEDAIVGELATVRAENEQLKAELAEADRVNRKLTAQIFIDGVGDKHEPGSIGKVADGQG